MKTIHKRLYSAISTTTTHSSRVRSNSNASIASTSSSSTSSSCSSSAPRSLHTAAAQLPFSFFESSTPPPPPPPNPSSRPTNIIVSSRPPIKAEPESPSHHHNPQTQSNTSAPPPYPLAFSSAQSDSSSHFAVNPNHSLFFPIPSFAPTPSLEPAPPAHIDPSRALTDQKPRYHLDVGAYGIPKHSRDSRSPAPDNRSSLPFTSALHPSAIPPISSGSAVQVGEDAYFVRENAMGVADGVGGWSKSHRTARNDSTPSALFAKRLMHYCSEEVDAARDAEPCVFEDDLHDQLDDSLEELADGLDVLMILERAYNKTMRAHVKHPDGLSADQGPAPSQFDSLSGQASSSTASPSTSPDPTPSLPTPLLPNLVPILEGSATALLAVLDHTSPSPPPTQGASSRSVGPHSFLFPRPRVNPRSPEPVGSDARSREDSRGGAVIRIAHLGDCVGMLIRGEEIVWRTEEMWWNFNTPLQLGPSSSTRPQDAKVFTIPVQEDDILVLASDGLSDNLWDEDILDEVVRFRRGFMHKHNSSISPSTMHTQIDGVLGRRTLAGMLSEALCSRARSVSERRGRMSKRTTPSPCSSLPSSPTSPRLFAAASSAPSAAPSPLKAMLMEDQDEIPFARRAREHGKYFRGGKPDDISVLIAVVSPSRTTMQGHPPS